MCVSVQRVYIVPHMCSFLLCPLPFSDVSPWQVCQEEMLSGEPVCEMQKSLLPYHPDRHPPGDPHCLFLSDAVKREISSIEIHSKKSSLSHLIS